MDYLRQYLGIFTEVKYMNCRICNIYEIIEKYAINMQKKTNHRIYTLRKFDIYNQNYSM